MFSVVRHSVKDRQELACLLFDAFFTIKGGASEEEKADLLFRIDEKLRAGKYYGSKQKRKAAD